jgi:hypothetical protein
MKSLQIEIKMKQLFLFLATLLSVECFAQRISISGRVEDETGQPVPFTNVYTGTQGVMSGDDGTFSFTFSPESESFTLNVSGIGYQTWQQTFAIQPPDSLVVHITLTAQSVGLEGVVVRGATQRIKGNGAWSDLSPIAIATTGGSAGDLYRALQTMPGVQLQAESGKLVVHGGDSRETQTYIDDMHVLTPYTTTGENMPARGRYSPFMFAGINFSSGGYSQEYGDGLSAVLPLYTKDESKLSKWGVNPSTVGLAGGGTKSFEKGSVSLNLDYCNLGPYFSVVPNRLNPTKPYQTGSAATQLRFTPSHSIALKSYISYGKTRFTQDVRDLKEDNLYTNTTFRYSGNKGYSLFAGAAFSNKVQHIRGARHEGDSYQDRESELHLKAKASKRVNTLAGFSAGVEGYIRRFGNHYADSTTHRRLSAAPDLFAAYVIATLYPIRNMNVDISIRLEDGLLSPRISANYHLNGLNLSVTAGRYLQQPEVKYLYANQSLQSERCLQYVAGAKYVQNGKIYRAEAYRKNYDHLSLLTADGTTTPDGHGYSKGVDLYFGDEALCKNLEYQFSYSFNLSERKSGADEVMKIPYYASRHNASLALKYTVLPLKSILGVTCLYASGRPCNEGFTKPYNSLDMSVTLLLNPKLIVYASVSNVLGIQNQFSNASGAVIRPAFDRFIYIGAFISLGGKSAYDVSNF